MSHGVEQTHTHTAEPLVAEPSVFEFEMAIEKLKRHKSPGVDQIPGELIKAEDRTIALRSVKLFIRFGKRRIRLRSGRSQTLYLSIRRGIKQGCSNYKGI